MKAIVALGLSAAMLAGCASIIRGTSQNISIKTSTGDNAKAEISTRKGIVRTEIPAMMTFEKSSKDIVIRIREEDNMCMRETTRIVSSKFDPVFLGNIILGGLIGALIDMGSGAMWFYDDEIIVPIEPKETCKVR